MSIYVCLGLNQYTYAYTGFYTALQDKVKGFMISVDGERGCTSPVSLRTAGTHSFSIFSASFL